MGDNFQPFIYGQTNFPLKMAVQHDIKLIMYGENGEVEYGGNMKYAESPVKEMTHYDNIMFSGISPESLIDREGVTQSEIAPYLGPSKKKLKNAR